MVQIAAMTDIGQIRTRNEDDFLLEPPVFAVADGMGGHAAGQKASRLATRSLMKEYHCGATAAPSEWLPRAILRANRMIRRFTRRFSLTNGMGTTLTACVLDEAELYWAHIGDSRLYLWRNGILRQITKDHRLVQELAERGIIEYSEIGAHPQRNILTRSLGGDEDVAADYGHFAWLPGDKLLLCSDGLNAVVADEKIQGWLQQELDPQAVVQSLINEALIAGAPDNVTVVVICV